MSRTLPVLLSLLLFAGPAAADPVDDLARVVLESKDSPNAIVSLLRGIGSMPDFELGPADLRRAVELGHAKPGSVLEVFLGPARRLAKRGDRLELDRAEDTQTPMGKGSVGLARKIRLRLAISGEHDAMIHEIQGIRVGLGGGQLDLHKVRLTREGGKPVCKVSAGPWLMPTFTIDMTPKPKPPAAGVADVVATTN